MANNEKRDAGFVIRTVPGNEKRKYMRLLLIGDESEEMIDRYLDRGTLHVGWLGDEAVAVCLVTKEADGLCEVKNLAVSPEWQRRGYGRRMLAHAETCCRCGRMQLGTGETPSTLRFYENCGYTYSHRIPRFFKDNYNHPIVEEGVELCDMIYLGKTLG